MAELDDRMPLNNWSIAASYDAARVAVSDEFAGLGQQPNSPDCTAKLKVAKAAQPSDD
jgi:hypothetical protein